MPTTYVPSTQKRIPAAFLPARIHFYHFNGIPYLTLPLPALQKPESEGRAAD
jgi:hypothetical protein